MNIADVYLFRAILKATIVVGFVFASLSLFVDFVSSQSQQKAKVMQTQNQQRWSL